MRKTINYSFRTVMAGAALMGGAITGVVGVAVATDDGGPDTDVVQPAYELNSSNETFGSSLYASSIEQEPDLIEAMSSDGTKGFVKKVDLYAEEQPKSPEEAGAQSRNARDRAIPVYEQDGKTVIGEFIIEVGEVTEEVGGEKD